MYLSSTSIKGSRISSDTAKQQPDLDMSIYNEMLSEVLPPPAVTVPTMSMQHFDAPGPSIDSAQILPLVHRAPKTHKKNRRAVLSPYGTRPARMEPSPCALLPIVLSPGTQSRRRVDSARYIVSLGQFEWFNDGTLVECEWNTGCTFVIEEVNRAAMVAHLSSSHLQSLQYGARCHWGYCNGCIDYGIMSALADHIMKVHMEMNVRVCPCCHEHLESGSNKGVIRRHMKNKHADFVLDETTPLRGGTRSKFNLA